MYPTMNNLFEIFRVATDHNGVLLARIMILNELITILDQYEIRFVLLSFSFVGSFPSRFLQRWP